MFPKHAARLVESATGFVLELIIYLRHLGVVSYPNLHLTLKPNTLNGRKKSDYHWPVNADAARLQDSDQ